MSGRVLFVSKAIVPPFFDGTKCLVRDLATHLTRYEAIVMGTATAPSLPGPRPVEMAAVYARGGAYAPALADNARAAAWLVLRSRADLWHFVFAPNPRASAVARAARALRGVPVVQTVASPPARFSPRDFFGDVVVAQSRWTAARITEAHTRAGLASPRLEVIPPPIGAAPLRTPAQVEAVRRSLGLAPEAPVFTYPGDLEVSRGADTVARAITPLVRELPSAVVVFACRKKTSEAPRLERALRDRLDPRHVRFTHEVDLPALLAATSVVLFPVDDLRGKVDLPISLLEAMRLGVPVIAPGTGPLADLEGAERCPSGDATLLARAAVRLVRDAPHRSAVVAAGVRAVETRNAAAVVARAYEALYDSLLRAR